MSKTIQKIYPLSSESPEPWHKDKSQINQNAPLFSNRICIVWIHIRITTTLHCNKVKSEFALSQQKVKSEFSQKSPTISFKELNKNNLPCNKVISEFNQNLPWLDLKQNQNSVRIYPISKLNHNSVRIYTVLLQSWIRIQSIFNLSWLRVGSRRQRILMFYTSFESSWWADFKYASFRSSLWRCVMLRNVI